MTTSSLPHALALALLLGTAPLFAADPAKPVAQPAKVLTTVDPAYPYMMRRAEAPAEVTVTFTVTAQGVVKNAAVRDSSNIEFNTAALEAIRKWTFIPAMKDGTAVDAKLQQTFLFSVVDKYKAGSMAQTEKKSEKVK